MNWFPETEHGGFIAASVEGCFSEEGITVNVLPGDKNAPSLVISELAAGRIDFAISDADNVVKARASDVPIVAVLAPLQKTPRCIMVHEDSGIQKLEDLKDVQLAISESRPFAQYMKKKLPLTNVTIVPYNGLVGEFLTNPKSAQQAFVFSEPFLAREQGARPRTLMVSEIGFNPYASVLITTESMIEKNPELVQKVVSASLKGWRLYLESPEKTNAHIATLNQNMTPAVLEFGASTMKDLCQPDDGQTLCGMSALRWQQLVAQIEEIGAIEKGQVHRTNASQLASLMQPLRQQNPLRRNSPSL